MFRVENPPLRPLLVYDGACRFCCKWVERLRRFVGVRMDYEPFQDCAARFPEIPPEEFASALQWITPGGWVYAGAEGVFRALALRRAGMPFLFIYRALPGLGQLCDMIYGWVARHREGLSTLDRAVTGLEGTLPEYTFSSGLLLRLVALCYLAAFADLHGQVCGLLGAHGILPAQNFLNEAFQGEALTALWHYPGWLWFNCSDGALQGVCVLGMVLAVLALGGVAPIPCFALLWSLYLSVVSVGGVFLGFQWDNLLLEAGLLCVFLAPWTWWMGKTLRVRHTALARGLLLWLLFRLMFASGVVKLTSGDASWQHLTALWYHFETQPLPAWPAFACHHLPHSVLRLAALGMFIIELPVPFLIFGPRRGRLIAAALLFLLQVLIAVTGNYGFFNYLSMALCLLLVDDESWSRLGRLCRFPDRSARPVKKFKPWPGVTLLPLAALILMLTGVQLTQMLIRPPAWPQGVVWLCQTVAPFRSINGYGLFAVMTTRRTELVLVGSNDNSLWLEYEFKWKPGDVRKRPVFIAPCQPRLDWQMWFAALGDYRQNPWFMRLSEQILRGSPEVLGLLKTNPFHDRPPKYVKALAYEYHFSTPEELRRNGTWWTARCLGDYCPPLSLNR